MRTVRVVFTKWGSRKHWEFDAIRLGEDQYGVWLGLPVGWVATKPDATYTPIRAGVMVVPVGEPWTAQFLAPPPRPGDPDFSVYVDITTPAVWDGHTVTMVDLDLDVIKRVDGSVLVADEDEFAQHQGDLGYPASLVTLAEQSCAATVAAVTAGREPFGHVGKSWLQRMLD